MRPALLILATLAACNPYDPDLGESPFRCGTQEPRCPAGYLPITVPAVGCACVRAADAPDAAVSTYFCNPDENDTPTRHNDSPANATPLDVELNPIQNLTDLAICPSGDEDYFSLMAPRAGTSIVMRVTFDRERGSPHLDIQNGQGASLIPSRDSPEAGVITATHTTTFPGTYLVKIEGDGPTQEVNYTLRLSVTPPE